MPSRDETEDPDTLDLETHLHASIIPEEAIGMADAFLEVAGVQIPVHKTILAMASPVFATAFKAAQTVQGGYAKAVVPIKDHALADVQAALKFLYQRNGASGTQPHESLCKSTRVAEPILKFAHKFNMQGVLIICHHYLSCKAAQDQGRVLFPTLDAAIAWASLADQCGLGMLSAHAEIHMVKNADANFWRSSAFAKHHVSQSCPLRILHAIQAHKDATRVSLSHVPNKSTPHPCAHSHLHIQLKICMQHTRKFLI